MKNIIFCDRLSDICFRSDIDEILNSIRKLKISISDRLMEEHTVILTHNELLMTLIGSEFPGNRFLENYGYMFRRNDFVKIYLIVNYSQALDGSIIGYLDFIIPKLSNWD